jgi:hypothetical protein
MIFTMATADLSEGWFAVTFPSFPARWAVVPPIVKGYPTLTRNSVDVTTFFLRPYILWSVMLHRDLPVDNRTTIRRLAGRWKFEGQSR